MQIIDTHAHLDQLKNLDDAMSNAANSGVEAVVAVSMNLESCRKNLAIKNKMTQPKIFLAMGIHPEEANVNDLELCLNLIRQHTCELTAIGEIGLDFWYKWVRKDQVKKDEQVKVYRAFLEIARELDLAAIIHSRGVWRECFEMAKEMGIKRAVFHWYSGPIDVLNDILRQGYYISTSPSISYSPQSREAISHAPIEQTLIETDSPVYYQSVELSQGFHAEPKDIFRTLKAYCVLKGFEEKKAVEILNYNARKLFRMENIS